MTAEEIAQTNLILRVEVGSGVYGVTVAGTDDDDEMGICLEPPDHVIGLAKFEQYIYRTQPQGVRSGPGDLDLVVYSLRKWLSLALKGNPSIIVPLFVPPSSIYHVNEYGQEVLDAADRIVSRQAGYRFLGYMKSQRAGLEQQGKGKHTNRPELIEKYGFDTKFAYHMLRLGIQGIELLQTGNITLPMPEEDRQNLIKVRNGGYTKSAVLSWASDLEFQLEELTQTSSLPERPDYDWANDFLVDLYDSWWNETGKL